MSLLKKLSVVSARAALTAFGVIILGNDAKALTISGSNSTPGNFDASSDTRTVTFTGLEAGFGTGTISDVNISINFAKADGEAFDPPYPTGNSFFNEIVFRLTSPNLTTVNLISANSFNAGGTIFDGTITFDDESASVVNVNPNLVQAGNFQPVASPPGNALSLFDGQNAAGTFTLFIQDTAGSDSLRFRNYTLDIQTDATAVPFEFSPGLGILVLGAWGAVAQLKSKVKNRKPLTV